MAPLAAASEDKDMANTTISETTNVEALRKNKENEFHTSQHGAWFTVKLNALAVVVFVGFWSHAAIVLTIRWLQGKGVWLSKSPEARKRRRHFDPSDFAHKKEGRMDPHFIDYTSFSCEGEFVACVREKVRVEEPCVLRNVPERYFDKLLHDAAFNRPDEYEGQSTSGAFVVMETFLFPRVGLALQNLIRRVLDVPPIFMARFLGGYKTCVAHIDAGAWYNFYYMRKGAKQVSLIPVEYSLDLPLDAGDDSIFLNGSERDYERLGHMYKAHWYFRLDAGDVLIFNNSAMLHQFTNLTGSEEIFSMRAPVFWTACSETMLNGMSLRAAVYMAKEHLIPRMVREIAKMNFEDDGGSPKSKTESAAP